MKNNYYDMLNESFSKLLLEAQQVVIDFKNIFGDDMYNRFNAQKQRMTSPENDISYWVRRHNEEGEEVINELDTFVSNLENKLTRREKIKAAEEGAELIYEDDDWLVYHITTYEAAAKYGEHTRWCITGRYEGREEEGREFFNRYLDHDYDGFYFFIKKGNDNEKYAVCPIKGEPGQYAIWDPRDGRPDYVPNGPKNVPGLPNLPVEPDENYDYDLDTEENEDDWNEEDELEEPEDTTWTDENGEVWSRRAPSIQNPETITLENPETFEFRGNKEEVLNAFKAKGFDSAEFVGEIEGTPLSIVKIMVEPKREVIDDMVNQHTGEIFQRDIPGDRFIAFVIMPGEGGPLLTQDGKLLAFLDIDTLKSNFIRMQQGDIHRQGEDAEPREENESLDEAKQPFDKEKEVVMEIGEADKEKGIEKTIDEFTKVAQEKGADINHIIAMYNLYTEILKDEVKESKCCEGYFYFIDNVDESCKLHEDECKEFIINVGDEVIKDIDGNDLVFNSELEANKYALDELELLQGDYTISCKK